MGIMKDLFLGHKGPKWIWKRKEQDLGDKGPKQI